MVDGNLGARKRAYVALLETEDAENEGVNAVVIGNRVSQTAVERSGLLSGIENTHGHASLPSQLSPEEVRLWETACAVEFKIPLDELVTVLKVADALGDENCSMWAAKVAERARTTDWSNSQKADAMLAALLRLPPHLLPTVLSNCRKSLDDMLATFPPPLHLAAINAAAQRSYRGGTIEMQHCNAAAALHAVACAPAPEASAFVAEIRIKSSASEECPTATGALLARAASSLSSLTSLNFYPAPLPSQWLRNFSACLAPAALPSLVQLRLSAHPGSCAEVINCLILLPALTHLRAGFHLPDRPASSEVSLSSYTRLAASPASLPNLKYLIFEEGLLEDNGAVSHTECPSCASSFLPMLCAPAVTKFSLTTVAACSPLGDLLASINRYPALQDLHMQATLRGDDVSRFLLHYNSAPPKLPPLTSFSTISTCPVSAVALATIIASGAEKALTSLDVSLKEVNDMFSDRGCTPRMLASVWGSVAAALQRLTGMKYLELDCICGVLPGDAAEAAFSRKLAAGLSCLTNLTHLRLGAMAEMLTPDGSSFLIGASIGSAIAALTALQSLSFTCSDCENDAELEFDTVQPVLDACTQLQGLKHLKLDCDGVKVPQIMQFLANQRALTSLVLSYVHFSTSVRGAEAAEAVMRAQYPKIEFDFNG